MSKNSEEIEEKAARWAVRKDRGLSADERRELEEWLAGDRRNAEAFGRMGQSWARLDDIPEHLGRSVASSLERPWGSSRLFRFGSAAAAALVAIAFLALWQVGDKPLDNVKRVAENPIREEDSDDATRTIILSDKTLVRLNVGAEVVESFMPGERRVYLERGEAHFMVTKDANRPFTVYAGGVSVKAIGTAFGVDLSRNRVDVLVTEGKVQVDVRAASEMAVVDNSMPDSNTVQNSSFLDAGHQATVTFAQSTPQAEIRLSIPSATEVSETLAWQDSLLILGGASLAEVARDFERKTGRSMILLDPSLENLEIGGRFRSDDVEGFVSILEENYGIRSGVHDSGEILLGRSINR